MHRLILGLENGDKRQTDHIDGNGLNNQKENLRICSNGQNIRWKGKARKGKYTSKYKGVNWKPKIKKWIAQICYERNKIHIGCYSVEEDAARAYNKKALELFGEFAKLNFIEESKNENSKTEAKN